MRQAYAQEILTFATAIVRFFVGGIFLSLYLSHKLGIEALVIFSFDFIYASIFMILFYKPTYLRKEENNV